MELVIWVIFETICVLAHLLMSMIPVADPVWGWTLSAYSQVFITLISIYIFRSYLCKEPALRSLGRKELKYCVWAAVIGVGICLGHRALLLFFLDFVEKSLRDIGEVSISNNAVFVNTLPGILYMALLGPATEDIFYRGVIFHVARQRRGNLYAVLISSFLFAIWHLNGVQFISALFMGVIIGYAVILTDNVYIGVVIHVVNNAFSLFNGAVLNKLWDFEGSFAFAPIGIGILLLVFGILMLRRETRKVAWQMRAEKEQ